jgi:RecB family exonuclease
VQAADIIRENLSDPNCVFVFPAEVSARFWLRRATVFAATLDARRFISWDRFKESAFRWGGGEPVTPALRTLFAAGFLERNRRQALLGRIIPASRADNSPAFQQSLERILPTLHRRREAPALDAAKAADLDLLYREYTAVLARENRFEPAYRRPAFDPGPRRYRLFFPEVIQDYPAYDTLLAGEPALTVTTTPPRGPDTRILAFDSSDQELRRLLLKIGALLDRGEDPEEIVVSAAGLEALEEPLAQKALLYEIPLRFHGARPLAGAPEARFFSALSACAASGFALEAVQALVLDHALPWRERALARRLVRFGIETRLISAAGEADLWLGAFRRAARASRAGSPLPAELAALQDFYARLRAACLGVVRAESFARLKEALAAFSTEFFAVSEWSPAGRRRFEFALRGLDELIEAETVLPGCPRPFALWQLSLRQRYYAAPEPGGGVAVYPYRVSAGIRPRHHFVINASQQGTRHLVRRLPFLSVDEEEGLPEAELDLSERHIDLYAASGDTVSFSYARAGLESGQLPPAAFVIRGRIVPAGGGEADCPDPWAAEQSAWAGGGFPERLFRLQRLGFDAASGSLLRADPEDVAAGSPVASDLAEKLAAELGDGQGYLRVTPTSLESYRACAFRFLLQRGAGVEEPEHRPVLFPPRESGELMHRVFQLFNSELIARELPLTAENLPLLSELVGPALRAAAAGRARSRPGPPAPIRRLLLDRIETLVRRAVELECRERPGEAILFAEHRLELRLSEERVLLAGLLDRVSRRDAETMLLDYKKKRLPAAGEIFGTDPVSFQMPFYLHLMAANGLPAARAAYYSLEEERFRTVWERSGRGMTDDAGLAEAVDRLLEAVAAMARGVRAGAYPAARPPARRACRDCAFRGVCRARYALRARPPAPAGAAPAPGAAPGPGAAQVAEAAPDPGDAL